MDHRKIILKKGVVEVVTPTKIFIMNVPEKKHQCKKDAPVTFLRILERYPFIPLGFISRDSKKL